MKRYLLAAIAAIALLLRLTAADSAPLRFVILGDRTGEARPGVFEQVWKEAGAEHPDFVVSVGDTIQGLNDATADVEWREVKQILQPYRKYPLYLAAGNHDVWSAASERLFQRHSGRELHYSFDHAPAHFTVLDNSRSDDLAAGELDFLEQDLKAHASAAVKFVFMHRPSWLFPVALKNPNFRLHQLARQYGVRFVIAGHVHQMMQAELQGVTYLAMPSSGGHLRNSGKYEDGWFFGHALVEVAGTDVRFQIEEIKPPHGEGRISKPADWSLLGLAPSQRAAGGSRSAGIPAR